MATLTGQQISDSYKDLLQISNSNAGVDTTLRDVEDGEGTSSTLQISTTGLKIGGTANIVGDATFGADLNIPTGKGVIHADGVTAGQFLRADGTRYVPNTLDIADITDMAYAAPGLTLGTANAEGAASTVIRSDATVLTFDATDPVQLTPDIAAAVGVATVASKRDHAHNVPAGAPGTNLSVSSSNAEGSASDFGTERPRSCDHVQCQPWSRR